MEIIIKICHIGFSVFIGLLPYGIYFFLIEQMNKVDKKTKFFKKDFSLEFLLLFINTLVDVFFTLFIIYFYWVHVLIPYFNYNIFDIISTFPLVVQVLFSLLIYDFFIYWQHRLAHWFFWPVHAIHHSAEDITWITGVRLHPFEHIMQYFFHTTALFIIGMDGDPIVVTMMIVTIINYMNHANINLKYVYPFKFFFVSPHYHRWHHANKKEAYDKNFAGIFSFWDILFGTYYHPEESPESYGLSKKESAEYSNTLIGALWYPVFHFIKTYRMNKLE